MGLSVNICIKKNTIIARLNGELDESSITELRVKLNEVINKYDINNIIFNMKNLSFMDSSGIGLIIGRYNQIHKKNGQVILCELNTAIERIITLSGLLKICTLRDSEESARWFLECVK